ncbi:hypothetical protein KGG70_gp59 [Streptomyces phage Celia]|uniref:Uncharacterized protein n=1 Tax=Streptomyces phage Celia TaxID=2590946 RepID=A0A516KRF4_9CAUD|nr:hypothetical protein KGG70_gp59 [Streptomyces phage Celia]QDP44225.1 hypothetical protein SEA_CELIA_22 [Streptomyces phage Celia]QFG10485.1 hypothetical protein SEA_URZA_22 [Streptomyces phage Urza]QJD50587.1 hypothetical protein SEA_ITZA_22 [Streptomyces phage Itza]
MSTIPYRLYNGTVNTGGPYVYWSGPAGMRVRLTHLVCCNTDTSPITLRIVVAGSSPLVIVPDVEIPASGIFTLDTPIDLGVEADLAWSASDTGLHLYLSGVISDS